MTLRDRFEALGFSVTKYPNRVKTNYQQKVTHADVSYVLSGVLTGRQSKPDGKLTNARAIISQLKDDGVWVGNLPWAKVGAKCTI